MKPWRVYRPGIADFHHFEEELDPDPKELKWKGRSLIRSKIKKLYPDPHLCEKLDPDPHSSEKLDPVPH
jgi:hypothetical protein